MSIFRDYVLYANVLAIKLAIQTMDSQMNFVDFFYASEFNTCPRLSNLSESLSIPINHTNSVDALLSNCMTIDVSCITNVLGISIN